MSEKTHIGFLGDESGSMQGKEKAMVEGFNEFTTNVKRDTEGKEVQVTLGFFDLGTHADILRIKIDGDIRSIGSLQDDAYRPWGSTPLNDATVRMIKQMEKSGADKYLLVIFTDGYENASETKTADVRKLISEKEQQGWEFIYLGANQDAWAEGQSRGVARTSSFNFDATDEGTRSSFATVSALATSRATKSPSAYRTEKDELHASMGGKIDSSSDNQKVSDPKVESAADKARSLISR